MPTWARPVRTLPRFTRRLSTDLVILSVASFLMSWMLIVSPGESVVDESSLVLSHHDPLQCTVLEDGEYVDRQLLVPAQGECRRVHHLAVLHERLVEGDLVVARGALVLHRVGGVDAVDLGRLEHDVGLHLPAAQRRRGVGGEERVARAGG